MHFIKLKWTNLWSRPIFLPRPSSTLLTKWQWWKVAKYKSTFHHKQHTYEQYWSTWTLLEYLCCSILQLHYILEGNFVLFNPQHLSDCWTEAILHNNYSTFTSGTFFGKISVILLESKYNFECRTLLVIEYFDIVVLLKLDMILIFLPPLLNICSLFSTLYLLRITQNTSDSIGGQSIQKVKVPI